MLSAGLILLTVLLLTWASNFDLEQLVGDFYDTPYAMAVVIGLFVVKGLTVFIVPQLFCYVAAGMLLPDYKAIFICLLGLGVEYTINFIAGKALGTRAMERLWTYIEGRGRKRLDTTVAGVAAMYLLPGVSRDMMGMMLGAAGMAYSRFLPASLGGSLPKLVLVVFIGAAALRPLSARFIVPVAVLACGALAVYIWRRRKKGRG